MALTLFLTTLMIERTFGNNVIFLTINETIGFAESLMLVRVFSLVNVMFTGLIPLGMAIFEPLSDVARIQQTMVIICAVFIAFLGLSIFLSKDFFIF